MKIIFMTSGTINSSLSYRPLAFAKALAKKGHEVSIVCPRFDKYSNFIDERISNIGSVTVVRPLQLRLPIFELGFIPYIISTLYHILKINPDIIHIYKANPITVGGILPLMISKHVVFDIDDLDTEVMKIEHNSAFKIKLVELSERICFHFAKSIITGSKYLHSLYKRKTNSKPVVYIPNGAEFSKEVILPKGKLSNNRLVFIGNINRINILQPLLYAVKKIHKEYSKLSVEIIGDGKYLDYFKRLSKKLGISNAVTFQGYIPRNQLFKCVKVGDIGYCYMPNERTIKACSSMKVFQYMQYGAVPLVSDVGDLPVYTFNGKAGYIVKSNAISALTSSLRLALSSHNEKERKLQFAMANAPKVYKWSVLADALEVTYKNIL